MTNQQILEKAIQKAIDGGFDAEVKDGWVICRNLHARTEGAPPKDIIFSHEFAKALWGEDLVYAPTGDRVFTKPGQRVALLHPTLKAWQYHIQQMVIADNPIKYLGEHLGD